MIPTDDDGIIFLSPPRINQVWIEEKCFFFFFPESWRIQGSHQIQMQGNLIPLRNGAPEYSYCAHTSGKKKIECNSFSIKRVYKYCTRQNQIFNEIRTRTVELKDDC